VILFQSLHDQPLSQDMQPPYLDSVHISCKRVSTHRTIELEIKVRLDGDTAVYINPS
jgi:hypothetical protein